MPDGRTEARALRAQPAGRDTFESQLRPLIEPACQLAYGVLGGWQEAEDAVQEAAFKAWNNLHRLREGTTTIRPWFLAIVRNQSLSVRRRRWFSTVRRPDLNVAAARPPRDAADRVDLDRAIAGLNQA
jgi:DNA-directed RNA polymerase specialized sigma24 family protein